MTSDENSRDGWTTARLASLDGSRVKALLLVALESSAQSAEPPDEKAAEAGRQLGSRGDLLETAGTGTATVPELIRIKDQAKVLMKDAPDGPQRDAARLLYHLTVAAAFVQHGAAISGRPMSKQLRLYERFAEAWAGHAFGRLFAEAATRVRMQHSE
jgi:hypothetical protein